MKVLGPGVSLSLLMMVGADAPAGAVPREAQGRPPAPASGTATHEWEGIATNVAVHATDGVHLLWTDLGAGRAAARGAFAGRSLFGAFHAEGTLAPCEADAGTCLRLEGQVHLGDDGSGYPSGTRATFTVELVVNGGAARGAYVIGPLPDRGYPQLGLLQLHRGDPAP